VLLFEVGQPQIEVGQAVQPQTERMLHYQLSIHMTEWNMDPETKMRGDTREWAIKPESLAVFSSFPPLAEAVLAQLVAAKHWLGPLSDGFSVFLCPPALEVWCCSVRV
jgi:hypothetical protein